MEALSAVKDPYNAFVSYFGPRSPADGPLRGARLCIKDNIEVQGGAFTAGHPCFANRVGIKTASSVAELIDAGACSVGMVRTDSGGLGMLTPGTLNPAHPGKTIGGSSGGCAAAIASGAADIGLGTDTGGSIRVPAACADLFAFKPTFGAIATDGVWPLSSSMDHIGVMAAGFGLLEKSAGTLLRSDLDLSIANRPLTLLVENELPGFTSTTVRRNFHILLAKLAKLGVRLLYADLPPRQDVVEAFAPIVLAEAHHVYDILPERFRMALAKTAQRSLEVPIDQETLTEARSAVLKLRVIYDELLGNCDALISPTLLIDLPAEGVSSTIVDGSRVSITSLFLAGTCFCNVAGLPALSMPVPVDGATLNVHLAAVRGSDAPLLAAARMINTLMYGG